MMKSAIQSFVKKQHKPRMSGQVEVKEDPNNSPDQTQNAEMVEGVMVLRPKLEMQRTLREDVKDVNTNTSSKKDEKEVWKYEGETNNEGKYHGIGKLTNIQTGEFYEGQWCNGMKDGFGTEVFITGERYSGAWKDNLMEGTGNLSYPNNDLFTGHWSQGKRVSGTFQFSNMSIVYREKWTDDTPGPSGTLEFNSGGRYVGEVGFAVQGRYTIKSYLIFRHGYGEMLWNDNKKYMGRWKNDKRKGYGLLIEPSGKKYYGMWARGKKAGYGVMMYPDGAYFEGQYQSDERRGKGTFFVPNGDVVSGEWSGEGTDEFTVKNAMFINRKFTDVPRPLRSIFMANVTAVQKKEDSTLFTSVEKWLEFLRSRKELEEINLENCDLTKLSSTIFAENETGPTKNGLQAVLYVLEQFIYLFNWEYAGVKGTSKKEWIYLLATAVDDVNSFIASLSRFVSEKLKLDYKTNKTFVEVIMSKIFPRVYKALFPLYKHVHKSTEINLRTKIHELRQVTPALIGVKPKFFLFPIVPQEEVVEDDSSVDELETANTNTNNNNTNANNNDCNDQNNNNANGKGDEYRPSFRRLPPKRYTEGETQQNSPQNSFRRLPAAVVSLDSARDGARYGRTAGAGRGRGRWGYAQNQVPKIEGISDESRSHSLDIAIDHDVELSIGTTTPATGITSSPGQAGPHTHIQIPALGSELSPRRRRPAFTTAPSQGQLVPLPYQRVIDALRRLPVSTSPLEKLGCLTNAAQGILACVDEYNEDKTKQIVMGAEDKFPVLIYALIRGNIEDLWCQCSFIHDFVNEHLGDEESKYRASEFVDALKYVRSLDWELRDENNVLVPLKMITSAVSWCSKGVDRLKINENPEATRTEILLCLSTIFRMIGSRNVPNPHDPLEIPEEYSEFFDNYEAFFVSVFQHKEVGLKLRKEPKINNNNNNNKKKESRFTYYLDFGLKHPLYVYTKLSEACTAYEPE